MEHGWNHAEALAEKHDQASDGLFVKLTNDGDKVTGVFVGEPYAREVHWSGERYVSCLGEGCSYCASGKKPSLRVTVNFFQLPERSLKVIEGGIGWFKDLVKVREKYGLDNWSFEIERHGEKGNPKTTYSILPEEKLAADVQQEIAKLALHELASLVSDGDEQKEEHTEEKRIEPRITSQYIARLKALPREAVNEFLAKFEVQRIRDLKVSSQDSAEAFLEILEGKYGAPPAAERDPFA